MDQKQKTMHHINNNYGVTAGEFLYQILILL